MELNEFNEIINSNDYVFVKFGAEWCGPCKSMVPIIHNLESSFPMVKFIDLDCEDCPELNTELRIRNIPAMYMYKSGKFYTKRVGFSDESTLAEILKSMVDNG